MTAAIAAQWVLLAFGIIFVGYFIAITAQYAWDIRYELGGLALFVGLIYMALS